jgi:hypothetical protein
MNFLPAFVSHEARQFSANNLKQQAENYQQHLLSLITDNPKQEH